ncbi:MAG TPA: tetratricopeptide repeat protein [Terrimicrobiaceae bacterium]|nr:tetratricopeptide repeat protein [Terrimicrobiaceae bacterium]
MARERPARKLPRDPADWPAAVLAAVLAFLLFLPTLGSGFVYDAQSQILIGDYVHDPAHFVDVVTFRVLGHDVLDANRPVQLFSLMVDSFFWGRNAFGYHLTSNLLHAAATGLLCLIICRLVRAEGPERRAAGPGRFRLAAFLGAMLFAAHPVVVEPVAEISCREDVLAAFFTLFALWSAMHFGRGSSRLRHWPAWVCLAAVVLACGSKETGVVAPFAVALYWLLFRRNEPARPWLALAAGTFVAAGLFLAARFALQPRDSEIFLHQPQYLGGSLPMVFLIQPRIWAFLVRMIFWPLDLSADYVPQNIVWITLPIAGGILAVFLIGQALLAWRSRTAALGAAIFWLGLGPVSNFLPIFRPVADRFLYLPLAGLAMSAAGLLAWAACRRGFPVAAALAGLVLVLLAGLSWQRQPVFANSLNLWSDTLAKSPHSDTAANNLGWAQLEVKNYVPALTAFEKALNLTQGRKGDAWAGAAIAFEGLGRQADAEEALAKAIDADPVYASPERLKAALMMNQENLDILAVLLDRRAARPPGTQEAP